MAEAVTSGWAVDEPPDIQAFAPHLRLSLDAVAAGDAQMLASGAYAPLAGFLGSQDWAAVVRTMRLYDGALWPLPIALPVSAEQSAQWKAGEQVALVVGESVIGLLSVAEVYPCDPRQEAAAVFLTQSTAHPSVQRLLSGPLWRVAGPVRMWKHRTAFANPTCWTPAQTRAALAELKWRTTVAFQTRNPIHRAHEHIIKCALEMCDGVLLHPLVGATKADDIPADVRWRCYEAWRDAALPPQRARLAGLPAPMRYAGPREAVHHALIRQNYGCTHVIIGRDHAGLGDFYGPYAAHAIFRQLDRDALRIIPLLFDQTFFCKKCGQAASQKTCPHTSTDHVSLSGYEVRAMLTAGARPPPEFTRPEVADILIGWARP